MMPSSSAWALEGKLNLNTASAAQLQELPFIGEEKANAIIKYRNKSGPFQKLENLENITEIGASTYLAIKPYLTLSGSSSLKTGNKTATNSNFISRVVPKIVTEPGEIQMLPDSFYYDTLISFIGQAKYSIDMAMFLFKTTKSKHNRPSLIVNALIQAKKRGVTVTVLLEESGYDKNITKENMRVANKLRKNKIAVTFDSPKTTTHTKVIVIDKRYCFVGSHNLTHSALAYNNEFSLLIDNQKLAKQLLNYMKTIK